MGLICARTKIALGEPDVAEAYRNMLEEFEPDSPIIRSLDELLDGEQAMLARMMAEFKKLTDQKRIGW